MELKYLIIGLVLMLSISLVQSATEADLYYKTYNPGNCMIKVRNPITLVDTQYQIVSSVKTSGNNIIKSFDGRPNLPPSYSGYWYGENLCLSQYLTYTDYPGFWDLVNQGYIERVVEYCPSGVIDPNSFDGLTNYKCNSLCHPNMATCTDSLTLKKCSSDGNSITTTTCDYQCSGSSCLARDYNVLVTTDRSSYNFGDSVEIKGTLSQVNPASPIVGVNVIAQVLKSGSVIKEGSKSTDSNGNIVINLTNVQLVGDVEIKLTATYSGKTISQSKIVTFTGEPILYKVTAYSYTQYDNQPIKFLVELKDTSGNDVYPDKISGLTGVVSLSNGQVSSSQVVYQGKGLYEISSNVVGAGLFTGKLQFVYQGTLQSSPIIEINVEKVSISIDTSKISSSAYLNDNKNYTILIFDPAGNRLNPDSIQIKVSFPDGTTVRTINFQDMKKISDGEYQYSFYFQQVEKYTFDIIVDKAGYIRGSAKVTVAVGSSSDTEAGPKWFSKIGWIFIIGTILFFTITYIWFKKRNRRRR